MAHSQLHTVPALNRAQALPGVEEDKAGRLLHITFLCQLAVEKNRFHMTCDQGEKKFTNVPDLTEAGALARVVEDNAASCKLHRTHTTHMNAKQGIGVA